MEFIESLERLTLADKFRRYHPGVSRKQHYKEWSVFVVFAFNEITQLYTGLVFLFVWHHFHPLMFTMELRLFVVIRATPHDLSLSADNHRHQPKVSHGLSACNFSTPDTFADMSANEK